MSEKESNDWKLILRVGWDVGGKGGGGVLATPALICLLPHFLRPNLLFSCIFKLGGPTVSASRTLTFLAGLTLTFLAGWTLTFLAGWTLTYLLGWVDIYHSGWADTYRPDRVLVHESASNPDWEDLLSCLKRHLLFWLHDKHLPSQLGGLTLFALSSLGGLTRTFLLS